MHGHFVNYEPVYPHSIARQSRRIVSVHAEGSMLSRVAISEGKHAGVQGAHLSRKGSP